MIAEGKITCDLAPDGAIRIASNRTADVGKLLIGRAPDEVLTLLPMIFTLCGQAHLSASGQALSQVEKDTEARTVALAVLAENAREHLLRIALGWRTEGADADLPLQSVVSLVTGMHSAAGDRAAEQVEADRLTQLLETHVFDTAPDHFLSMRTVAEFCDWVAQTPTAAAGYLAEICANGWQALGAAPVRFLPDLPAEPLAARLTEPSYTQAPDWLGLAHETGPLERQNEHPLLAALTGEYGAGLLVRLVARLVDLAGISEQMQRPVPMPTGAEGLGVVDTARGRLVHFARLRDGVISDYRILAPTEWNFHPKGAAANALGALPRGPRWAEQASILVQAIDPCVDFEVRAA